MSKNKKIVLINIVIFVALLVILEAFSSIVWYQTNRRSTDLPSSTADIIQSIGRRLQGGNGGSCAGCPTKFGTIQDLRAQGTDCYPTYLFNPQMHADLSIYHLANPALSTVVYCNENDFWATYQTDEMGFRNPPHQIGQPVDYIFLGDSFTEGACVQDEDTFAGRFRQQGHSVLNLGRGGSGPLFQLAVLREYGASVKPEAVIWFVFSGNDLANLREEKTSKLIQYLDQGSSYSQDLFARRRTVSNTLKQFLDAEILIQEERQALGLPTPTWQHYGETLDVLNAKVTEIDLFSKVAREIRQTVQALGADLIVVVINHPSAHYKHGIQDLTARSVLDFAAENDDVVLNLTRGFLTPAGESLYSRTGPHFSPKGYRYVADHLLQELGSRRSP